MRQCPADLKDVSALNGNPLTCAMAVETLAEEKYRAHIVRRGFALREIILRLVEEMISELITEPSLARMCLYLKLAAQGIGTRKIGQELGLSREHVSRTYRRQALELLGRRLRARLRG